MTPDPIDRAGALDLCKTILRLKYGLVDITSDFEAALRALPSCASAVVCCCGECALNGLTVAPATVPLKGRLAITEVIKASLEVPNSISLREAERAADAILASGFEWDANAAAKAVYVALMEKPAMDGVELADRVLRAGSGRQ